MVLSFKRKWQEKKLSRHNKKIFTILCTKEKSYHNDTLKHWHFSCPFSQNEVWKVLASRELFETYFITISYLRKEALYGKKYTREQELEHYKNNIREHL